MADKQQKFAFNDRDMETVKSLFAENDVMVSAVRNHFLSFPMTSEEKAVMAMLSPVQKDFIAQLMHPVANAEHPMGRFSDAWGSIDTGKGLGAFPFIKARHRNIKYIDQQIALMNGGTDASLTLDVTETDDELEAFVQVETRRSTLALVDNNLMLCVTLAGLKEETVKQTQERLLKDSSK